MLESMEKHQNFMWLEYEKYYDKDDEGFNCKIDERYRGGSYTISIV
jgi:hypothetical protein